MASLLNMSGGSLLNKGLLYDAEIEYLESSGTQYIDTGIKYSTTNKYEIDCELVFTRETHTYQMNGWDGGGAFGISVDKYTDGSVIGIINNVIGLYITLNLVINSASDSQTVSNITINNNLYTHSRPHNSLSTYAGNSGYILFACYSSNKVTYRTIEKIYTCKIRVNNTIVRDYIPVRVGTTGYLYDKVSGQLFGNQGTGNFILGPDKTN